MFYENRPTLQCHADHQDDFVEIFQRLSQKLNSTQKYYSTLLIRNSKLTMLPNILADFGFENIEIANCSKLTRIYPEFFTRIHETLLTKLVIFNTPIRDDDNLFKGIQKLAALHTLVISNTSLTKIPYKPFNGDVKKSLRDVSITHSPITSIGSQPFYELNYLTKLTLSNNKITSIANNAFTFYLAFFQPKIDIDLSGNDLRHARIGQKAFAKDQYGDREITLHIDHDNYDHVPESVYKSFIEQNKNNVIYSDTDCHDIRNDWLHEKHPGQSKFSNCK